MKDSQLSVFGRAGSCKYIKANNERFSTTTRTAAVEG